MQLRWLFVLSATLWTIGCGGENAADGDGGAPPDRDGGTDAAMTTTCARTADCDDGVFCNGQELCRPGEPGADAMGCVAGDPPCGASQTCNEMQGRCESDCDTDPDSDGDGYRAENCGGDDCDDSDGDVNPGKEEICDDAGRNEDCDPNTLAGPAETDLDGDGYVDAACCNRQRTGAILCGLDCDDGQAAANPGYPETCDEIDNDCDEMIDERVRTTYYRDADEDLYGDPADTMEACTPPDGYTSNDGDCDDTRASANRGADETCNDADDDCDTRIDEEVSPPPATAEHCGGCGLACPAGYECQGTTCIDRPIQLAGGAISTCALTEAGNVWCWGSNHEGEVGVGSSDGVIDRPRKVDLPAPAVDVHIDARVAYTSLGPEYFATVCAVLTDDRTFCWGSSYGDAPAAAAFTPPPAGSEELTVFFAPPSTYGLARKADGSVQRLEGGTWMPTSLGPAVALAFDCARQSSGDLRCSDITSGTETSYSAVSGGSVQAAGYLSVCATRADGRLLCWGQNAANQIGSGSTSIASPTLVEGLPTLEVIAATVRSDFISQGSGAPGFQSGHTCAALVDGRTYCWGGNDRGQLGIGSASTDPVTTPTRVMTTERFVELSSGFSHTCAISEAAEVWCWGANNGVLGTADTSDAHTPVRLFGLPETVSPSP
jgi:hypothetical protein